MFQKIQSVSALLRVVCPVAGLLGVLVGCDITITPDPPKTAKRTFERTVDADNVGSLTLDARTGNVTFTVDPDAEKLVISGTKRASGVPGSDADEAVREIEIDVRVAESDPAQVFVQFDAPPDTLLLTYEADFNIVAPNGMDLHIEIEDGSVTVSDNEGEVSIAVDDGGHITVEDQAGEVSAETGYGIITVDSSDGDVEARTTTGRITVSSAHGSVNAWNSNGDIEIAASPVAGGAVFARTITGDVSVEVPTDFGTELALSSVLGEVTAELKGFEIDEITVEFNRITATLNGGGGVVEVETEFGDVLFAGF